MFGHFTTLYMEGLNIFLCWDSTNFIAHFASYKNLTSSVLLLDGGGSIMVLPDGGAGFRCGATCSLWSVACGGLLGIWDWFWFSWAGAQRGGGWFLFLGSFLLVLVGLLFWRGGWVLGYHSMGFRQFLHIS